MPFPVFFANPDMLSRKNVEKEKAVQAVRDYYSRQLLGGPFIYTKATITAVWHRTYNDPRIHLTVMFHHGSSDYRTFHIPIHSEATSIVFPDVDIENEGVNSDRKTHPLSHGVSNITSCSHPAGESEVGDGVNITTDSDSNVISCFGSANDTPTVKTEYTTGACHGGQRNLTDSMHWFEKMAPITLPSSSSNSSSNHTAQKLALKARTKSPTEGISDIASGSDRLNDTISIGEGLLDPEAKSPTEGISDITPALAQPTTLFESIGQNQVTRKSHMTLGMSHFIYRYQRRLCMEKGQWHFIDVYFYRPTFMTNPFAYLKTFVLRERWIDSCSSCN